MGLILVLLLLGTVAAFLRASSAGRRADRLEHQVTVLEQRLATLEAHAVPPRSGPADAQAAPIDAAPAAAAVVEKQPAGPARLPVASRPVAVPKPPRVADETRGVDLEAMIGGRWLLFAGVAAIVLGMSYFVKFAFDNGWISEPLRVAAGAAIGILLVGSGIRFSARGLALFGQALAGAGTVLLYVSIYAALHFYALIGETPAFVLMVLVTAGAAWLSDRQRSQPLAALALVGGFATPLLVGGERDTQVVLFTYMGILIAGAAALGRRHDWPLLGAASYVCTFLLVIAWFFSSYEPQHWLRTELFLTVYVALFGYMLATALRAASHREDPPPASALPPAHTGVRRTSRAAVGKPQLAVAVLATAPVTYHLASVILLFQHPAAWLVYAVVATLAGLMVAHRMRSGAIRVLVLPGVGLPMIGWLDSLSDPRWYVPGVMTVFALYALHLAAHWEAGGDERGPKAQFVSVVYGQLNGLLLAFSLYVFLEDRYASLNPWMTAGLSAWNAVVAVIAHSRAKRLALQFTVLSATLGAIAFVLAFDGPAVAFGWAAEGVFVAWLAMRERSRTLAAGSAALILLGALQLGNLLSMPLPAAEAPLLNPRALAAALVIAMLAWLAWRIRDDEAREVRDQARTAVIVLANLLALALVSADLRAYFAQRALDASIGGEARAAADASLAEQVALSVTWALYAVGLVFVGIRRRFAPARYLAIGLFGVVVAKVLVHDIAGLDRLYRMLSVLGVGVLLLVASYLYQKMAADLRSRNAS